MSKLNIFLFKVKCNVEEDAFWRLGWGGGASPANLFCQIGAALVSQPRCLLLKLYRYKISKELSVNKNHSIRRIYREVSDVPSTSNAVGLSPLIPLPLGELELLERIFCSLVSCQFECQEMSPLCKIN